MDADIDPVDNKGCTPLSWACGRGHLNIVILLLKSGANINHQSPEDGLSPILEAVSAKQMEVLKLLIKEGA
jgi:ankyrin repeat protein